MRYMKRTEEKYRIKGKTYYKIEELPIGEEDACIINLKWRMENSKNKVFLLYARTGKCANYALYDENGKLELKTRSISKIND